MNYPENRLWRAVNLKHTGTSDADIAAAKLAQAKQAEQRLRDSKHLLNAKGIALLELVARVYKDDADQ